MESTAGIASDWLDEQPGRLAHAGSPQRIEQAAAICLRRPDHANNPEADDPEILLIASSSTGKWGLPKGHIEPGETSQDTALREAFEEAGIEGQVSPISCGSFQYQKPASPARYHVAVHILTVSALSEAYPEECSRRKKWVPLDRASREVGNPDVARILDQVLQDRVEKVSAA